MIWLQFLCQARGSAQNMSGQSRPNLKYMYQQTKSFKKLPTLETTCIQTLEPFLQSCMGLQGWGIQRMEFLRK